MPILDYVGNGPYCYANSAAMLLESAGESIEPRLGEVLSGVGLGAFWLAESQARQPGRAQAAAARCDWEPLVEHLTQVAHLERDMEAAVVKAGDHG